MIYEDGGTISEVADSIIISSLDTWLGSLSSVSGPLVPESFFGVSNGCRDSEWLGCFPPELIGSVSGAPLRERADTR